MGLQFAHTTPKMAKILMLAMLLIETISEVRLSQDRPQFYGNLHWYPPRFTTKSQEDSPDKNSVLMQQHKKIMGQVSELTDRYPFFKRSKVNYNAFDILPDYEKELSYPAECSHCQVDSKLTDLGRDYFPRYIPEVECGKRTACPGILDCRRKNYQLAVLKRREENELDTPFAPSLPAELREKWIFKNTQIAVACECGIF